MVDTPGHADFGGEVGNAFSLFLFSISLKIKNAVDDFIFDYLNW